MEPMMNCEVCGCSANVEGVETAAQVQGFLTTWSMDHRHTAEERKQYHDAQIAVEEYRHSHPFAGEDEDD